MSSSIIVLLVYVIYITMVFVSARTNSKDYLIFEKNLMRGSIILLAIVIAGCFFGAGKGLMLFPIYPLILYVMIYDFFGYWMWHFDGRIHFKRDYTLNRNPNARPATLYWSVKTYPVG